MVILLVNDFSAAAINLSRSSSMASWAAKSLRRRFILSVSAALKLRWFAIFSSSVWRLRVFFFKSRICLSISLIFRSRDVLRSSLQRSSFSTSASNCFAVFSALSAIITAFWLSKKGSRGVESNASGRSYVRALRLKNLRAVSGSIWLPRSSTQVKTRCSSGSVVPIVFS